MNPLNLQFNMAIHVLTFLSKHEGEHFTSAQIAESVCVNPVQLRRVLSVLNQHDMIISKKGKTGGYCASKDIDNISLGNLFQIFCHPHHASVYTGNKDNPCLISRNIETIMSQYDEQIFIETQKYYNQILIRDIKHKILSEV